ncbi:hypothetical protein QUB07_08330 [Microcoleus sp. F8-C5]
MLWYSRIRMCLFISHTGLLVVSCCWWKFSRSGLALSRDWLSRSHWQIYRPAVQVSEPNPLVEISLNILAVEYPEII